MLTALDDIRKKAREAHAQQHYLKAEQHYRTLLEQEPDPDDVINLGALMRSQGRLKEGSDFYKQWVSRFRINERLLLNACNCWNDNNEAQLVLDTLKPLLEGRKIDKSLKMCFADALHRLNRFKECTTLLKQLLENEPKDKKVWIRLGLAHSKNNELSSALEAFENVNQIDPNDLEMIANRITILTDLGRFDEAEGLIETLNSNQKLQADVAQATAGLLLSQKKLVEATTLFQHVCRERPHIASYWLNWAAALRGLRRTVAPYGVLKRGLCHVPNDEDLQEALQQIGGDGAP